MSEGLEQLHEIITAPRTDAVYNCHAYLTKVPIAAIAPFIEAFMKPGELVADFFAGSGMTGPAAMRVNRRARLSDISVLGQHIATGYLTDVSEAELEKATADVFAKARKAIGGLLHDKAGDGWGGCRSCADGLVVHVSMPVVRI
jgi:hypothetical protein